jgi:hypothetical protein
MALRPVVDQNQLITFVYFFHLLFIHLKKKTSLSLSQLSIPAARPQGVHIVFREPQIAFQGRDFHSSKLLSEKIDKKEQTREQKT